MAVLDGRRVKRRFREVEVELIGAGDEAVLERIGDLLRASGATESQGTPKVFRALGLDFSLEIQPPGPSATPLDRVLAAMRVHLDAIRAHDPGTRLGADPEELHQMRVAVRRLRAVMRVARRMFARRPINALREELAWLGAATWRSARPRRSPGASARGASHARASGPRGWPGAAEPPREGGARALARSSWWPSIARVT